METAETEERKRRRVEEEEPEAMVPSPRHGDVKEENNSDAPAKEADRLFKKPRVEETQQPPVEADTEEDVEAILLRALEEAIEKDAAKEKELGVVIHVDEDDDYDESD